ncbi:MAG: polymerase sigma24 factor [Frankiales bacterium]|nr:polymerase sigma24 factor [Frankiales bacterium]
MDDDERTSREFVRARERSLLRRGWLLTGDWAAAEDLVQGALLRVWPKWRRACSAGQEEAYVRRTMLNLYLSGSRRRWRAEAPVATLPERDAPDTYDAVDTRLTLAGAMASLPPRQRAVIVLRFVEDLSETQTALALDCAAGTVKSQTSKALAALRRFPDLSSLLEEHHRA